MQNIPQNNKLFAANIDWRISEAELHQVFAAYGGVLALKMPIDRMTGRSRGFAFLEMETPEQAASAIEALNGFVFYDRPMVVKYQEDRPRPQYPPQGGYMPRPYGPPMYGPPPYGMPHYQTPPMSYPGMPQAYGYPPQMPMQMPPQPMPQQQQPGTQQQQGMNPAYATASATPQAPQQERHEWEGDI
jgi:RNA recognition motif-containing protein